MEVLKKISTDNKLGLKSFLAYVRETFKGTEVDPLFEERAQLVFRKFAIQESPLDGEFLTSDTFAILWDELLSKSVKPKSALVIVDFQNDFIDGTLSLKKCPLAENPDLLLPKINKLVELFDNVVYTFDWHPQNHISFIENVLDRKISVKNKTDPAKVLVSEEIIFEVDGRDVPQLMWPRHCVQNTEGALLHKDLKLKSDALKVNKGTNPDVDSYSAFWDNQRISQTDLNKQLQSKGITNLYVCGLAFDACVCYTAVDAITDGYTTTLIKDATCAISTQMSVTASESLSKVHCVISDCDAVEQRQKGGQENPLEWPLLWQAAQRII